MKTLFRLETPTLYLNNWAAARSYPREQRYCIMAYPQPFMEYNMRIPILAPDADKLAKLKTGQMSMERYRHLYYEEARLDDLAPGVLCDSHGGRVPSGAMLFCICSHRAAEKDECHRVWAAKLLNTAEWSVILDGDVVDAPKVL
jgi:hypothetical protein